MKFFLVFLSLRKLNKVIFIFRHLEKNSNDRNIKILLKYLMNKVKSLKKELYILKKTNMLIKKKKKMRCQNILLDRKKILVKTCSFKGK